MSRAILVMGIPRSGTSCVAGILHQLGVNMGAGHFQSKDKFNQRGYFEDLRWRMLTQRMTGRGYSLRAATLTTVPKGIRRGYRKLARQCSQEPLWGVKDPWFCFVPGRAAWTQIRKAGTDVRMVIVRRDLQASRQSVAKHLRSSYGSRYGRAGHIVRAWYAASVMRLAEFDGPVLEIHYEELIDEPGAYVRELWAFVSHGMDIKAPDFGPVAKWVTPSLQHFKGAT